ncbi:3-carboxy-cis,cis-muconate cycloisomerase [Nocardioides scoriae]|uniref:3-carboxy-cis,cis-muconate cycloisomerase n=1 Tax=Nocardioides scoriae TaxID=642780 RepID=A0A1H1NW39_9ACTN|nr:lyase family protein [Nocardioides scoriae]SDS03201.1 3-carboxy-cis,cis-muconate cycloisomerase [Nocardioides scoriae]
MTDLFWPGDDRAEEHLSGASFLASMVTVEQAWLDALVAAGAAPADAALPGGLAALVGADDLAAVAGAAEASGNPVVPLLRLLRQRLETSSPAAARWLHRGLTSQDVVDTALVLGARAATARLLEHLDAAVAATAGLAERHRDAVVAGRTLTQHAVPITFGLKAAHWLAGLLDARDDLRALRFPVQVGGAAGTLAAVGLLGDAEALVAATAGSLGLEVARPWHTVRTPLTRCADALVRTTDALGHVADDVLVLARPEVGELAEPAAAGRGGSSTMPHKANPVLSVLVRRAALTTPGLAAQLHLAAAGTVDERPDGAWHTEWATLATLGRRTLAAASQSAELLAGLHVDTARMAARASAVAPDLLAEQRGLAELVGAAPLDDPTRYLGATGRIIDEVLTRAREETP